MTHKTEWDVFVAQARNGTFLFSRDYMDYHSDRFVDYSLMAYYKGRLVAVLPANLDGDVLHSHQGLTYGGWVTHFQFTASKMCMLFVALHDFFADRGIKSVIYKALPWIYHSCPSEEDLYALTNVCGSRLIVRHLSSAIDLRHKIKLTEARLSGVRKAMKHHLTVKECSVDRLHQFWEILEQNLAFRHHARPVHRVEEMSQLMHSFPQNIRLFMVYDGSQALGGTLLYITSEVVHTQYISASEKGKKCGALDMLFNHLLSQDWSPSRYFDFGKSSDGHGELLNETLIFQKEGFGGRGVCYDWYEWVL